MRHEYDTAPRPTHGSVEDRILGCLGETPLLVDEVWERARVAWRPHRISRRVVDSALSRLRRRGLAVAVRRRVGRPLMLWSLAPDDP